MNWEAIGAIGELASALAVLATLVYLSLQIRHQTKAMEESRKAELAKTYRERTQNRFEILKLGASSNEVLALNVKLEDLGWPENIEALDSLNREERRRLQSLSDMQILQIENNLYLHKQGLIDSSIVAISQRFLTLMAPGWRALGREVDHLFVLHDESGT